MTTGWTTSGQQLNDVPGRLRRLGVPQDRVEAVEAFLVPLTSERTLPRRVTMLMAFAAATAVGNTTAAAKAIGSALESGLSRQELLDGLLTCVLGRGVTAITEGLVWLEQAPVDPRLPWGPSAATGSDEDMLAFLIGQNPDAAESVRRLAAAAPEVVAAYYSLRSTVLDDGALPRRHKELLLVAINATERYDAGVEVHLGAAVAAGASRLEVTEALLVAVAMGGIPAWHAGSAYLSLDD